MVAVILTGPTRVTPTIRASSNARHKEEKKYNLDRLDLMLRVGWGLGRKGKRGKEGFCREAVFSPPIRLTSKSVKTSPDKPFITISSSNTARRGSMI